MSATRKQEIVAQIAAGTLDPAKGLAMLEALNVQPASKLYAKVSAKGGVSAYGLQRMPITLYKGQWERLLEGCDRKHFVLACIDANGELLSDKADDDDTATLKAEARKDAGIVAKPLKAA